jgi:hypothetical protein
MSFEAAITCVSTYLVSLAQGLRQVSTSFLNLTDLIPFLSSKLIFKVSDQLLEDCSVQFFFLKKKTTFAYKNPNTPPYPATFNSHDNSFTLRK